MNLFSFGALFLPFTINGLIAITVNRRPLPCPARAILDNGIGESATPSPKAPHEAAAKDIFQKLTMVTSRFLSAHVNYYGFVPRDDHVRQAIMAQRPFVDVYPHSAASRAVTSLYNNLIERAAPTHLDGGLKFLWQRVLRESSTMAN